MKKEEKEIIITLNDILRTTKLNIMFCKIKYVPKSKRKGCKIVIEPSRLTWKNYSIYIWLRLKCLIKNKIIYKFEICE